MKKILVWAYLKKNLGDDLFIKILNERYKDIELYFIDIESEYLKPFNKYGNIYSIKYKDAVKNAYKFSSFIDIGGSIFQFRDSKYGSVKKRLLMALIMKSLGKKSFVLGANFGPYIYKQSINICKIYFKVCADVCLRDKKSYDIFKELKSVRLAPDIVFGLDVNGDNIKEKDSVGISVMDLSKRNNLKKYKNQYINKMIDIIDKLQNDKKKIYLISFSQFEGDREAIGEIISGCKNKEHIEILEYKENIEEFLNSYKKIESIISCRFHSFILSQVFDQATFPIVYSNKLLEVLNDIDMGNTYSKISELENLEYSQVIRALSNNKIKGKEIFNDAMKHFNGLDKIYHLK